MCGEWGTRHVTVPGCPRAAGHPWETGWLPGSLGRPTPTSLDGDMGTWALRAPQLGTGAAPCPESPGSEAAQGPCVSSAVRHLQAPPGQRWNVLAALGPGDGPAGGSAGLAGRPRGRPRLLHSYRVLLAAKLRPPQSHAAQGVRALPPPQTALGCGHPGTLAQGAPRGAGPSSEPASRSPRPHFQQDLSCVRLGPGAQWLLGAPCPVSAGPVRPSVHVSVIVPQPPVAWPARLTRSVFDGALVLAALNQPHPAPSKAPNPMGLQSNSREAVPGPPGVGSAWRFLNFCLI